VDLNYLFHRQQVERSRSETAETKEARTAHEDLAKLYQERIETVTGDDYRFPKEE
jgi:predicted acetyltransferase